MPSPRGSNRERLFLPTSMAFDAALPARALIDQNVEGEGEEAFSVKVRQILGDDIDDEDLAALIAVCRVYFAEGEAQGAESAPEAMATDRQRQQRLASARAHDPEAFAKRYPDAARIKNLGGR
jgi:hypothetical protein